jgi:NTP pyrophosphatase (non-canonical NTP hydrolase)
VGVNTMTEKELEIKELMARIQEECAEVIQAVSKINIFGIDNVYEGSSNKERFQQELGDVVALIMILSLRHPDIITGEQLGKFVDKKINKLRKYIKSLKDFDLERALEEEKLT